MKTKVIKYLEEYSSQEPEDCNIRASRHYSLIKNVLQKHLQDDMHSWEGKHRLLLNIKSDLEKKGVPEWLAKRVPLLLLDPEFELNSFENHLTQIDNIYQQIRENVNPVDYDLNNSEDRILLALKLANQMKQLYKGSYEDTSDKKIHLPSLGSALENITNPEAPGLAPSGALCTQIHQIFSLILDMYGLENGATALYISKPDEGVFDWHMKTYISINEDTTIRLDLTNGISALGHLIYNFESRENNYEVRNPAFYEEIVSTELSYEQELEVSLNNYYWAGYKSGKAFSKTNIRETIGFLSSLNSIGSTKYSYPLRNNINFLYSSLSTLYSNTLSEEDIKAAISNIQKLIKSYSNSDSDIIAEIKDSQLAEDLRYRLTNALEKYQKLLDEIRQ